MVEDKHHSEDVPPVDLFVECQANISHTFADDQLTESEVEEFKLVKCPCCEKDMLPDHMCDESKESIVEVRNELSQLKNVSLSPQHFEKKPYCGNAKKFVVHARLHYICESCKSYVCYRCIFSYRCGNRNAMCCREPNHDSDLNPK